MTTLHETFWVRDINHNDPDQPHGWRGTSRGFALVGCEPCEEGDVGAYLLDWTDHRASLACGPLWQGSMFDIMRLLDRSRRYRATNMHEVLEALSGEPPVALPPEYELESGPFEFEFFTFPARNAPPRHQLRCAACGEASKKYLVQSRRLFLRFQSMHRCVR